MRLVRLIAFALALACLSACDQSANGSGPASDANASMPIGTGFDFYVLALSWSPGYCESAGEKANKEQCSENKEFGFVLHGLWPQFNSGYPEDCTTSEPLTVHRDLVRWIADIMPSAGLVQHEWRKHGTCSGLGQGDYFAVARAAYETISIPPEFKERRAISTLDPDAVEEAMRVANPGMAAGSVAVTCDRRFLRDVRICLSKDLAQFVSCPEVDRNSCRLSGVVIPPT